LEHADRGDTDLSSPCDHQPQGQLSRNGSRHSDAPSPEESFGDYPAEYAGDIEDLWLQETIHLEDINTAAEFIKMLQSASLDDPSLGMSFKALEHLRNPLREQPLLCIDNDTRLVIDLYMGNPSEATYEVNRKVFLRRLPGACVLSYYKTRQLVADLTGVESMVHHMCINSCIAYTGPFSDLDTCLVCSEAQYDHF
jgi:hypothetical protein